MASIITRHNNKITTWSKYDHATGLAYLFLAIGFRVVLHNKLWTEGGLVNCKLGMVNDFVYKPGLRSQGLQQAIVFDIYDYYGLFLTKRFFLCHTYC